MEIQTPKPEPKTVTVKDIDITTVHGAQLEITLWPEDSENENDLVLVFDYAENHATGRHAETVSVFKQHIAWISRRNRTVELPPDTE